MQSNPRGGAGGGVNAPYHLNNSPTISTAGTETVTQTSWANQQPAVTRFAKRLMQRHGISAAVAFVIAEARCFHG